MNAADVQMATWIDKSEWGDGPWQREPDRIEWRIGRFPALLLRNPHHGMWCGYVGVPRRHPWYGKAYDEIDVDVHGGLTFGDRCMVDERPQRERVCHLPRPGESDDIYWLGFDCHHFMDLAPGFAAREREVLGEQHESLALPRTIYRTAEYAVHEVKRLAEQAARARAVPWRHRAACRVFGHRFDTEATYWLRCGRCGDGPELPA